MVGLAMTVKGGETACYRCLFPEPPPPAAVVSCSEAGRARPDPRHHRRHPGARGHQGDHRRRPPAVRPSHPVRRRRHDASPRSRWRACPRARCAARTRPSPSRWTTMTSGTQGRVDAAGGRRSRRAPSRRPARRPLARRASRPSWRSWARPAWPSPAASTRASCSPPPCAPSARTTWSRTRPSRPPTCRRSWRPRGGWRPALGVRHVVVETHEFDQPSFVANPRERCYFCKRELVAEMRRVADEHGCAALVDGANLDDLGDHRPGMQASAEAGVRHPLLDAGIGKAEVRRLARDLGLRHLGRAAAGVPGVAHPVRRAHHRGEARGGRGGRAGPARARLPPVPRAPPRRRGPRRGRAAAAGARGRRGARGHRSPVCTPPASRTSRSTSTASAREA